MAAKKINIEKLIDSYVEISSSDALALNEALKEYGYDPQRIETKGVQKIKQLLFQHQVASKKNILQDLYAKAVSIVQLATADSKEVIFSLLQKKSPSLQFRNLEKLDEENLRQILNETEILDLIDKLEKGDLK
jgi:hypothetical protein